MSLQTPVKIHTFQRKRYLKAIPSLIHRLESIWKVLWSKSIDREELISRSMLSPATCCLVNPDNRRTVERAFSAVKQMSDILRDKYL